MQPLDGHIWPRGSRNHSRHGVWKHSEQLRVPVREALTPERGRTDVQLNISLRHLLRFSSHRGAKRLLPGLLLLLLVQQSSAALLLVRVFGGGPTLSCPLLRARTRGTVTSAPAVAMEPDVVPFGR